jgi:TonB family protein
MEFQRQNPSINEIGEVELLEVNLRLWENLSDEVFDRHFRESYFGEEMLTRSEAIARLKGRLDIVRAHSQNMQSGISERAESVASAPFNSFLPPGPAEGLGDSPSDFQPIDLVAPYRPIPSLLISTLLHLIIIGLICVIRIAPKRRVVIDFDREKITYFKVNGQFPTVAPSQTPEKGAEIVSSPAVEEKVPEAKMTETEIRIHPEIQKPVEMIVEQPEMPLVDLLPKLVLPNILLKSAKTEPGKAPLVPEKPKFTILDEPTLTQSVATQPQIVNPESAIAQNLKMALPSQPLPALPVIEEPKSDVQGSQLHSASGPDILVYSNQPSLPKGELAVPKVNSTGRMISESRVKAPAGTEEFGKADIVIPAISIKNQAPTLPSGVGVAVIQAPLPPTPEEEAKNEQQRKQTKLSASRDRLPSLPPGFQPAKLEVNLTPDLTASPLQELERQGKTIYSTSMNSPNFTSKRGSWIFRFAELRNESANPGPSDVPPDPNHSDAPLTAPSATVKVDPKYPPEVIREKVEGHVVLYAVLRKDGIIDPATVRIIQKLDPRLDVSARDALIGWKFKPSLKNGQPVEIQAEITIPFYFRDDWFKH